MGSDVGCGVQFTLLDIKQEEFDKLDKKEISETLRYIYFERERH